jgi:hypothetical protein
MKNVRRPICIPQDLKDTVTALHMDAAALVQRYLDGFRFYPYFSTLSEKDKSDLILKVGFGMTAFQRSGKIYVNPALQEINQRYGQLLYNLSKDQKLSPKAHDKQSIVLVAQWEKEARPLINYPQELMLEGGGVISLSFDFMLINMDFGHKIRKYSHLYMQRISMAHLYAHTYPGNKYNNKAVMRFFQNLWEDEEDVFLPRSSAHNAVIEEYAKRFAELFESSEKVKNFNKRILIFRPLINEWAEKMKEINQAELAI